jgi:hypothetical protein
MRNRPGVLFPLQGHSKQSLNHYLKGKIFMEDNTSKPLKLTPASHSKDDAPGAEKMSKSGGLDDPPTLAKETPGHFLSGGSDAKPNVLPSSTFTGAQIEMIENYLNENMSLHDTHSESDFSANTPSGVSDSQIMTHLSPALNVNNPKRSLEWTQDTACMPSKAIKTGAAESKLQRMVASLFEETPNSPSNGATSHLFSDNSEVSAGLKSDRSQSLETSSVTVDTSKRNNQSTLKCIPVYHLTESEFEKIDVFIESVFEEVQKYGMCKVVPPASWSPGFHFDLKEVITFDFSASICPESDVLYFSLLSQRIDNI